MLKDLQDSVVSILHISQDIVTWIWMNDNAQKWLGSLSSPIALFCIAKFINERLEIRKQEEDKVRQEITDREAREEALQMYYDRISALLIGQNILAIANKLHEKEAIDNFNQNSLQQSIEGVTLEQQTLLHATRDIIRARTLSILRRLGNDAKRKTDVIQFLLEVKVIQKIRLSLSGVDLSEIELIQPDFSEADIKLAKLENINIFAGIFHKADLVCSNLKNAECIGANFSFALLSRANLSFANLSHSNFMGADFNQAELTKTNLSRADLSGANLSNAKLHGANLSEADFSKSVFVDFDQNNSSSLNATYCRSAKLGNADLSNANLCNANLSTISLDSVKLNGAEYSAGTRFPDGFEPIAAGMIKKKFPE